MMKRTSIYIVLMLLIGMTVALFAQLPGPPVGVPQTVQSGAFGYNFQYTFTPNATTGAGVRIFPTISAINGTAQTQYLLDVGGVLSLPGSAASATTFGGLHVGTVTCTLNSGTVTTCANLVVDPAPATGTAKYAAWFKGDVQIGATPTSVAGSLSCGASLAAGGACPNTAQGGTFKVLVGTYLLAGSTSTITGIAPAYTSSTSYNCVANDITTRANPVQAIPASGSSVVITNTTGATDLISMICAGN